MDLAVTPFEALQKAVSLAGGQSATARICKVSQTAVWKWLKKSRRLPAEYVLTMAETTGVSPHLLRPDIYPLALIIDELSHNAECGTSLPSQRTGVACDHESKAQRKDHA